MQRLLWFSRGYFTVQRKDSVLVFNDIRFGRSDSWLGDEGAFLFSFHILRDPADTMRVSAIEQIPLNLDGNAWRPLFERIGGR